MSGEQAAEGGKTEQAPEPVSLMWMSVVSVRDGRVVEQRSEVRITSDMPLTPHDYGSAWPPCQCPRHRDK